ncbi:uncharacterized protein LOC141909164 [Tubulanus polymorphus]|uniref:uncharacterized protein LOC141909164 n=1 Tax=Tubulanus polymorphus TaxID=672921 RepID=UPI003DA3D5DE
MPCGVCGYRHNILLHRYTPAPNISPTDNSPTDVAVQQNRTTSSFIKKPRVAVGMPIVPVKPKLPIDRSDIPRQEEIDRWVHLDGVRVSRVDAEVGLIIGSDNSLALEPIEVRSSSRGGPYAVKTIFGWAVNGPLCTKNNRSQPKSCSIKSCSIKSDESLNKQFEVYCNMEFNDLNTNNLSGMSYDDKRALTIMESTVKLTDDGHYELSLPWKHDKPSLPNNRALAKHRFDLLERRFDKDPKLKVEYTAFVDKMINSGFCELIPDEDLNRNDGLVWQERVAFMADVEGMFNQVRVTPSMCDVLRFLWFSSSHEIVEDPRLIRDLFGDDVIETVLRNFYVDDCLKSVCSNESAVDLLSHVIKLLAMGGFRLTQVSSNSRRVLESVSEAHRAKTVKDLSFDQLPFEHALGVLWNMDTDEFCFKVNVREDARKTRRGILASVSTLYDPIGFTAPLTLRVKSLLQELCRLKLGWDDSIPDRYEAIWLSWLTDISKIEKLAIERCFKPCEFGEVKSVQLHHFSDASEAGYGSVSYIRLLDDRDRIHCSFVTGKSRVTPLKFTTIPRLELAAATVSIRLDCIMTRELDFDVDKTFYWTDSTSVLKYIRNEDKRFQVFVANRVGVIREHSEPSQWNFVDGKLNPADDASRGLSIDEMNRDCRWLKGPDFLWKTEESWPTQPDLGVVESSDVEVKRSSKACASSCKLDLDNDVLMSYFALFSSWSHLKKSVAWILRFKRKLMRRDHGDVSNGPISVGELREAERAILSYVQRRAFPEAFNGSTLKKSSILALSPVKINDLLCVRGRLGRSELSESSKHPIILPKNGHITDLIVRFYHDIYAHRGREYTLSKIRLKFWVVNGKSAVWRTISKCINCRKRNAKLSQQKMSDLPPGRVSPDKPPFSFVGLDYFGPFLVKRGRVREKRYGCIFTCLASRSVHLEVCHSLDTDSFISGLRRFIARRGQPEKIRSGNGTNLVGGQRELKDAINNWNQDKIQEFLLQKEIEWEFNPPAASNMGGVWERLIRSVRSVLCAITKEQVLDDESLLTLMCEVEAIVNGRPLTSVSDDPTDLEPLTPNHLLILRSGPTLPPGSFSQRDLYVRRRWRQRNFVEGDIVLVKDDQSHRSSWSLSRVIETYAGSDSLIRSVKLKTKSTELVRPVNKDTGLYCSGILNGSTRTSILLDTGASVTLLKTSVWEKSRRTDQGNLLPVDFELATATGANMKVHGVAKVELQLGTCRFMVIADDLAQECLLGSDFFEQNGCIIDYPGRVLECGLTHVPLETKDARPSCCRLFLTETCYIPGGHEVVATAYFKQRCSVNNNFVGMVGMERKTELLQSQQDPHDLKGL